MKDYIVIYDINHEQPKVEYSAAHYRVEAVLSRLDGMRLNFSVWAVRSPLDPIALANQVKRLALMDGNDILTVVPCDFNLAVAIKPRAPSPPPLPPLRTITSELPIGVPTFRQRSGPAE